MCGIVGIIGNRPVQDLLVGGLKRLEYRGYDSAGIATVINGAIDRRRAEGKLINLEILLKDRPLSGSVGIGHTRWATHGQPTESNAHPHATDRVAVVHNGIIENFSELRSELQTEGCLFETETDTEVVAHLLSDFLNQQLSPQDAVMATLKRLKGAFALAIIFAGRHDLMVGARRGSPLAIGYGDGEMYLGSDALALAPVTNQVTYLEEDDWVELSQNGCTIRTADGDKVERPIRTTELSGAITGKGLYRHFMQKEIFEQPVVVGDTVSAYIDPSRRSVSLPNLDLNLAAIPRLTIIACGTAFYAGAVAKYWLEQIARQPVEIDVASEFRYREAPMPDNGVTIVISQSGETIDSLAALRYAKQEGQRILSIVNVPESAIARESDMVLPTLAGPEIGVASTKAFTTQLSVLAALTIAIADARGHLGRKEVEALAGCLFESPNLIGEALAANEQIRTIASKLSRATDVLYLGRGSLYPIALEGALKLKEISYIHAEGYAAGEMKHGPIALIDERVPVIVCAPSGPLFEKTASNIEEVHARGGAVVLISDRQGIERIGKNAAHFIELPAVDPFSAPIVYAAPLQLLAYHTAVVKGTDVDQPRNLAKSVTVE
jgi:glucosamine--fructose-6-phosphate aminotransferase (isomerizing)